MSRKKDGSGKLSEKDMDLWRSVSETVVPIEPADPALPEPRSKAVSAGPKQCGPAPKPRANDASAAANSADGGTLDRRTRQKLMRGNVSIDRRIDLHGLTRHAAQTRLVGFLNSARNDGLRTVLVITGKGNSKFGGHTLHGYSYEPTPERTGVLRAAVAEWLASRDMQPIVAGFQPAHPRHGGGGAFYVRLRRHRS